MGNKNTSAPRGPDSAFIQEEEDVFTDGYAGSVSGDGEMSLGTELLTSLQSLGENSDYTLLPHSLHQIAEAYSLQEDYQWAIRFLQLEKLYHERLLSNLAAQQENWESRWRETNPESEPRDGVEADGVSLKHIETLSQICQTHHRPSVSVEKSTIDKVVKRIKTKMKTQTLQSFHDKVSNCETSSYGGKQNVLPGPSPTDRQEGDEAEVGEEEKEIYEEGHEAQEEEPCVETPDDEEEVKVEWPAGVPQASDKDLAKLSHSEGCSSPDGLVSILKRRRASLDGLPPPSISDTINNTKRKVRFSEPEDGIEQDEVSGDSCLILLLLCLVTVVISIGGTALYCTLVDTYSNICTDFTQNVNFYAVNVRRFFEGLNHWLPGRT